MTLKSRDTGFGCWFGDLPSAQLPDGSRIRFEILWQEGWKGKDFEVGIAGPDKNQGQFS
jgi:hypothetical protein